MYRKLLYFVELVYQTQLNVIGENKENLIDFWHLMTKNSTKSKINKME